LIDIAFGDDAGQLPAKHLTNISFLHNVLDGRYWIYERKYKPIREVSVIFLLYLKIKITDIDI